MKHFRDYKLKNLKHITLLPEAVLETVLKLSNSPYKHVKAAGIVIHALASREQPIGVITTRDTNDLLRIAPTKLITSPFVVFDPFSHDRSIYSEMLTFLVREQYCSFVSRRGNKPGVIEIIDPVLLAELPPVTQETREFLLESKPVTAHG